jgi:AraC-like DNA-binding protein
MLHYSTEDVHPRDRLSYWLEVVTKTFAKHNFLSRVRSSFEGKLTAGALADVGVANVVCSASDIKRTSRDIARDDFDNFIICSQVSGTASWEQNGRQAVCTEGCFVLMDTARPFSVTTPQDTNGISLAIPRRALEARLGDTSGLTARALDGRSPIVALAQRLLAMLPDSAEDLDASQAARLSEHVLDIIALAISTETHGQTPQLSSPSTLALTRLKLAIDNRLCDPDFKPSDAAAAAGMSVRYANALLSRQGTSLGRYIVALRLDRCRRALEDTTQQHRSISDIALGWGFSDLSHFCRRFKTEFGCSPSEYRQLPKSKPELQRTMAKSSTRKRPAD